jgi:hypothetical protein
MTTQVDTESRAETSGETSQTHFLLIAKVKPGHADAIRELVDKEGWRITSPDGPLAQVGTVHFARWALIDDETLLFESHFDGDARAYLDDFFTMSKGGLGFDVLLRHCEDWPGLPINREAFVDFWTGHRVEDLLTYSNYPGVTCKEIAQAVRIRRNLEAVLEDFQ